MAGGFTGEAKTDAHDAVVIANTARMRRDFLTVEPPTELVATLALLVAHRADLVEDWVRRPPLRLVRVARSTLAP